MSPENFCYWLRGYIELTKARGCAMDITAIQVEEINNHLDLVMKKETPSVGIRLQDIPRDIRPLRTPDNMTFGSLEPLEMDDSDLDPAYQRFISSPPTVLSNQEHMVSC